MELAEFSKVIATKTQVIPIILTVCSMFKQFAITLCKFVKFSLKRKNLPISRSVPLFFIWLFFIFFGAQTAWAQVENPVRDPGEIPLRQDSLIQSDTIPALSDTTSIVADSSTVVANSDIETTIKYSARDSIRASID